ncbi:SusC/RagA family TonB-linked outer membrane protein [Weeksellaceae bacterium TAE3-ERU29]|nr:SusC/RagA family TonB-linked outer membrane protein [Weeksellaceae bacterium TAE3-ERU29]
MRKNFTKLFSIGLLCFSMYAFGQQKPITGKVLDSNDYPVQDAYVYVEGQESGVYTDGDGNYTIQAKPGDTISVEFIGFDTKSVTVGEAVNYDIKLLKGQGAVRLQDVVAVAYGTQSKDEIAGSVSVLDSEALQNVQSADVMQGLTGKVAGVQVINSTGQPGDAPTIRFRGIGSINASSDPLYVVNGVPFNGNISSIPSQDIESITFLKDASANALYGHRGANGVVLITTKKGKRGLSFNLDVKTGFNDRAVPEYDIMTNPAEYYEAYYQGLKMARIARGETDDQATAYAQKTLINNLGYNVYDVDDDKLIDPVTGKVNSNAKLLYQDDWGKAFFKPSMRQEYFLSGNAGSDFSRSYFSLSYLDDKGYALNSGFRRYTARLSTDFYASKDLGFGVDLSYARTDQDSPLSGKSSNAYSNLFSWARNIAPIYPIYGRDRKGNLVLDSKGNKQFDPGTDKDDFYGIRGYGATQNPVGTSALDVSNNVYDNVNGRAYVSYDFFKDFNFKYNLSIDLYSGNVTRFATPLLGDAQEVGGRITTYANRGFTFTNQQLLSYDKNIGDHSLSILVGHESTSFNLKRFRAQKTQVAIDDLPVLNNAVQTSYVNGAENDYKVEGYLSRINYSYANRYFFNGSFRRDGSSIFHPDARWGNFYGAGAAWNIAKEIFLENATWLDQFKLKASFGKQGNDNLLYPIDVQNALSNQPWGLERNYMPYADQYEIVNANGVGTKFVILGAGKKATWETSTNINAGVEFALFDNRLSFEAEYFERKVDDLLLNKPITPSTGFSFVPENVGAMENKGYEVSISGQPIRSTNFDWNINFNITHFDNKVTKLNQEFIDYGTFRYTEGKSIYDYFLRKYVGYDKDGNALWLMDEIDSTTKKPTGKIVETTDYSKATKYYTDKSAIPDFYGGFGTSLRYKGFTLGVDLAYQIGGYGYDGTYSDLLSPAGNPGNNLHKDFWKSWTPNNKNAELPRFDTDNNYQNGTSDFFLVDASYLNIQNVNLGYELPESIIKSAGLEYMKFYVTGSNLYLWSKRKGYDPRLSTTGLSSNKYGLMRTISVGVNVKF